MVTSSAQALWIKRALALAFILSWVGLHECAEAEPVTTAGRQIIAEAAPPFTVTVPEDDILVPVNVLHRGDKLVIHPANGSAPGPITVTSDTAWVRGLPSENRPNDIDLLIDTNGVATGEYPVKLKITASGSTLDVTIKVYAWIPFVKRFIADPARPRVYALSAGQYDDQSTYAKIVVLDVVTGKGVRDLDGTGIYNMVQASDGSALYGLVYGTNEVVRFDLERMVRSSTGIFLPLAAGPYQFQPAVELVAGPGSVLYFLGQSSAVLTAFDTSSGATLQTIEAPGDGLFFQKLAGSPEGRTLVANQAASGVYRGPACAPFVAYDIAPDGRLSRRNDVDTPVVAPPDRYQNVLPLTISGDGRRISYGERVFEAGKPFTDSIQFTQRVVGQSPGGEFVIGENSMLSGDGNRILGDPTAFYFHSPSIITPEGKIFYSGYQVGIGAYDPRLDLGDEAIGFKVSPAADAKVAAPLFFRWLPVLGAREYRLYLSRNAADLTIAHPSGDFLVAKTNLYTAPNTAVMAPGDSWSWRVDAVGPDGMVAGEVRSFTVGAVSAGLDSVDFSMAKGCRGQPVDLSLSSASPASWTASSSEPWLTFASAAGSSPGTLRLVIDATLMGSEDATATVTIQAAGTATVLPVRIRLKELNGDVAGVAPAFVTASDKHTAFALLHPLDRENDGGPDFLVRVDPATGAFIESRRLGSNGNLLRLSPDQSQLGVESDAYNQLLSTVAVYDVETLNKLSVVAGFSGVDTGGTPGTALGPDGLVMFFDRLVHWPDMQIRGILPDILRPVYSAFSPDGKSLYGLGEVLSKLDATDPGLHEVKSVSGLESYGQEVFCSKDGSRLAAGTAVFDADLNILGRSTYFIRALNRNGSLAYSSDGLLNVPDLKVIATPPSLLQFSSFYDPGNVLVSVAPSAAGVPRFNFFSYADVIHIDPDALQPGIADGGLVGTDQVTLSWTNVLKAGSYHVFIGTSQSEIDQAAIGEPSELGSTTGTSWVSPIPMAAGTTYFWKIIMDGVDAQVPSPVWSFHTSNFFVNVETVSLMTPRGGSVAKQTVQISVPAGVSWSSDSTTPWLDAGKSGTGSGSFNVNADPYGLAAGDYTGSVTVTVGTESIQIPVKLKVFTYHVLVALPDPAHGEAHLIIGLGNAAQEGEKNYLARLDMAKHQVVEIIDIGARPQYGNDYRLVLHPEDDRIYVINPVAGAATRRYDRSHYALDISLDLSVITSTQEGTFFFAAVSAGPGKIAVPLSTPFSTSISVFSTVSGAKLSQIGLDAGGSLPGLISAPGGKRIYCNRYSNTTRPVIYYDISDDGAITQSSVTGQTGGSSIAGFALSADGSVLLWNGGYYHANLSYIGAGPSLLAQKSPQGLSGTGKFTYLADTYVVTKDGSNVYLPEPGGFTSGNLISVDGLSNQYLAKDMYSSLSWVSPLEPATSGLPAIPGRGFLSYGGQGWKPDASQPGTVVCRNPRNLECSQFLNYSVLGVQFPAAGTLSFQWRRIASGNESLTFRSRSTSYTAPTTAAWETHTLAVTSGSYASWEFYGDLSSLSASASAEIRNVTFTSAGSQGALAVSPVANPDSDHDGFSDLMEKALGSDAAQSASRPVVSLQMTGGQPAFVYEHPAGSAYQCVVQISADLLTWEDLPEAGTLRTSQASGVERVSVPLPAARQQLFTRLRVESPAE